MKEIENIERISKKADIKIINLHGQNKEVLIFINTFGKTYAEVLGSTFYASVQSARNTIVKMKKRGLVTLKPTGLIKPQNEIVLSSKAKVILKEEGYDIKDTRSSIKKLEHNMIEQIAYYHLGKVGHVERKSVYHHMNTYHSVPDLEMWWGGRTIFIEVETTQKSKKRYLEIVKNMSKDDPSFVLYIAPNTTFMMSIAKAMPLWDKKLYYIDIDTLIHNVKTHGKVKPFEQKELLK